MKNTHMPNPNPQMLNMAKPYLMHIDLNSCFAIIEQQANRLLRGRPVGIAAYDTPRGFVLAASYQAKRMGIKLGVNVEQARGMCPGIVIMTPDPAKYREAHRLFKAILLEYSPSVTPKSIDEFILDLEHSPALKSTKFKILNSKQIPSTKISNLASKIYGVERQVHNEAMLQIGKEIKRRIAESLGEYVTVNIGIAPNRFLAKYAAGFGKPDGMTLIDYKNLESMYDGMKLVDLPGINTRYRARLRLAGIYTPLDFLWADMNVLKKQVFKSIVGYYWYQQLRGYEIEVKESGIKTIGHQYALPHKTTDIEQLERLLMKLCEKTGRRLRKNNLYALGVHLYLGFESRLPALDGPASFENMHNIRSWHHGEKVHHRLYSTSDIYEAAKKLLHNAEIIGNVKLMSVTVFNLCDWNPVQASLFEQTEDWGLRIGDSPYRRYDRSKRTSDAVDAINNRYGEFVINPAIMMDMNCEILDRIAFGQVRDM